MTRDHLLDHLTEPSTVRGIAMNVGCLTALILASLGYEDAATQSLATAGLVAGLNGALTSDRKRHDQQEAQDDAEDADASDYGEG